MLALEIYFDAGRYHATPWYRHINEAAVAWPPEPWRLLRALIAVWHRKLDSAAYPEPLLESLVERLAATLPVYRLPPGVLAHTRHYVPILQGSVTEPTLIFDAFARLDCSEPLVMAWPEAVLTEAQEQVLDALLIGLGYLGRAESWVTIKRLPDWTGEANCAPAQGEFSPDRELVTVLAPLSAVDYARWREGALATLTAGELTTQKRHRIQATLPERLLDALQVETGLLRQAGWNQPPAGCWVTYHRSTDALAASIRGIPVMPAPTQRLSTVRWRLYGKPLPRVQDTVHLTEHLRAAVMSRAKDRFGADQIPPVLSGHAAQGDNDHGHAFYLAEDADDDGYIDHLLIHANGGLDEAVCQVLDRVCLLRRQDGQEFRLLLESIGTAEQVSQASHLLGVAATFISVTPYLHPWYRKKGFGPDAQLRRECRLRGLTEFQLIEPLETVLVGSRSQRPVHFRRTRSRRDLAQPDTSGSFWRLTFEEPIRGPLALGFGCHFGLGLFKPVM